MADSMEKAIENLSHRNILVPLVQKLSESGQLKDFYIFVKALSTGQLDVGNISVILALERARYATCTTTTNMHYSQESLDFWRCVYRLLHGVGIRFFSGPKHFGQIVSAKCEKGKYDPATAKCNFAVPSESILRQSSFNYPSEIYPGFVEQSISLAQMESEKGAKFFLSFDGKKIGEGLKGEKYGDVQLMGYEQPNLEATLDEFKMNVKLLTEISRNVRKSVFKEHKENLLRGFKLFSNLTRSLRKRLFENDKNMIKLEKLKEDNPDNTSKYKYVISKVSAEKYVLKSLVSRALKINKDFCCALAMCNHSEQVFCTKDTLTLANQSNFWQLLPPEALEKDFDLLANPSIVRQGSDLWKELRRQAPVTGSTLHNAIGQRGMAKVRHHVKHHIMGEEEEDKAEGLLERLQWGSENEVNGIATLCGCLLPALRPQCTSVCETGPIFIDGDKCEKVLEVSADGYSLCINGDDCPYSPGYDHSEFVVEIKCPFPGNPYTSGPHYQVPWYYVCQVLAEMECQQRDHCLYVCYTPQSTTLCRLSMDRALWLRIMEMCNEWYDIEFITMPETQHGCKDEMEMLLKAYTEKNCEFLAEVPSITGTYGVVVQEDTISPYGTVPVNVPSKLDFNLLTDVSKLISVESNSLLADIHHALRQRANELVVFMLSNTERLFEDGVPHSIPVAYCMKPSTLPLSTLRRIINQVRNRMKIEGIPVECECYDGQWSALYLRTEDDEPLTEGQVVKQSWKKSTGGTNTKQGCFGAIKVTFKPLVSDLLSLGSLDKASMGASTFLRNLEILHEVRSNVHIFTVLSGGGGMLPVGRMTDILPIKNPEYWQEDSESKQVGLMKNENLLTIMPQTEMEEFERELDLPTEIDLDTWLPDLNAPTDIDRLALHGMVSIVEEMVWMLQAHDQNKWVNLTKDALYPSILKDAQKMDKFFVRKDLDVVAGVIHSRTGRKLYLSKARKAEVVNVIAKCFGSPTTVEVPPVKHKRLLSLVEIAENVLKTERFPLLGIQSAVMEPVHKYNKLRFEANATTPLYVEVPENDYGKSIVQLYSYPERALCRQQIEPRTGDVSHMLTNLRSHLTTKNLHFVEKNALQNVANMYPAILSKSIVDDMIDKQNVAFSKRVFSKAVAQILSLIGCPKAAKFVTLVHNWFMACDERGVPVLDRVRYLVEMHEFLRPLANFNVFPPIHTQYVQGLPIVTFESILQNIATRLQMYGLMLSSFNNRALSTLACESQFADIVQIDRQGSDTPSSVNIPRLMAMVIMLNYLKHKPNKSFYFWTSSRRNYPAKVTGIKDGKRALDKEEIYFKSNWFDYADEHTKSKRIRKDDISFGAEPLKNVQPVRQHYKVQEEKILPEYRYRIPSKL